MTTHEANHLLGRLYMNDKIDLTRLMQLTAMLENPATRPQALKAIQRKAKTLSV